MHELKVSHEEPFHSDLRFSLQTKGREVCAVSGRVESFAGEYIRPSRAGCTTGAPTSSTKKKRRTEKQDATSQQRIDSYMSNTFLGRMRATGQLKEAPVSKGFFERYKKISKKAKKGVKIEPKKEGDKQLKQLKFHVGKKD